ncbi:MAG: DUF4437 domain-containing protein [Rhodospirillaceae bacterium]
MARDHVEYLVVQDMQLAPLMNGDAATGFRVAKLSQDYATGAVSYFGSLAPQWIRRESGYYESDVEFMVMSGDLSIGDTSLSAGHYCYLPAGCLLGAASTNAGCELFMMFDGPAIFTEANSDSANARKDLRIDCLDAKGMPWGEPPSHPGRPAEEAPKGLSVKYLRVHPETNAYTLMVRQSEGWFDPKLERHSIWEELILLDGDYLMGKMGKVNAGTYIFRDGVIPHGPQVSRHGSVWLGRGPGPIDFDYMDEPWAMGMVEQYLSAEHIFTGTHETGPWGSWM